MGRVEFSDTSREFFDFLNTNPELARKSIYDLSLQDKLRELFYLLSEENRQTTAHLPALYTRFLGNVSPDATMLFLGSGNGAELLHARAVFPKARIIGVDKVVNEH